MRSAGDVFIVGPVRSGTSWLQTMLAEHPSLASPPETHLFARYLGPLDASWRADQDRLERGAGQVEFGLPTVMTEREFLDQVEAFYATTRALVLAAKPGATRLLEKTPDHAHWLDTMWRVAPDASVIFMVRDPRATVRSVLTARNAAWGDWAPHSVADATSLWLASVRAYFPHKRDARLTLVRYEDLVSDPAEFERVAKFVGLDAPERWQQSDPGVAPSARTSIVRRGGAQTSPYAPNGFSFHDKRDVYQLSKYDEAYIVSRCRDEMEALGYDVDVERSLRLSIEHAIRAVRYKIRQVRRS
jgi:hypothetical protein